MKGITLITASLNLIFLLVPSTLSFTGTSFARTNLSLSRKNTVAFSLRMSSSSSEETNLQPRRRKRKDGRNSESIEGNQKNMQDIPRDETRPVKMEPVQLQVQDVRELVSGTRQGITQTNPRQAEDDEVDDDYEEEEEGNSKDSFVARTPIVSKDDSLEALLADAKRMREKEAAQSTNTDEPSIPKAIKSVISAIVTADFFVVCALLLWFLAGIFCSYVLKDDTVQIAFNGIFEPVVQPALGILMIGSAAGAAFGDEKKDS